MRAALSARDFYATNARGLRLDATAQGTPMGRPLADRSRTVTFEVDLDRGPEHAGNPVEIQVLTSGDDVPTVIHVESVRTPSPPDRRPMSPGPDGHPCNNLALAYASPFYFEEGRRPVRHEVPAHRPGHGRPDVGRILRHGH